MKIWLLPILALLISLSRCSKDNDDLSGIYVTDAVGNPIGTIPNDNQWKNTSFLSSELALFNELDTANLSGTQLPVISNSSYGYPNPFVNTISVTTSLAQPLNGYVVIKYVIVDNKMNAVQKGGGRVYATSFINLLIGTTFGSGKYRLYFTYSADGHEHFFKAWGNIQKS